jgi:hypothetical protein
LLLCKATEFDDPKQLANAILKYALGSSCIVIITHMEGEEIFGPYKQKVKLPLDQRGIHIGTSM